MMTLVTSLLQSKVSRVGFVFAVIWLFVGRPFWRHVFVALSTMAFAGLLMPDEMAFFAHHPVVTFAVPFTAGFVGVHLGRSKVETFAAWVVLAVLAIAIYRAMLESW
jgi:hypothetical protein